MKYFMAFLISIAMLFSFGNLSYAQSPRGEEEGLKLQVEQLQKQVDTLQTELKSIIALAPYVSVDQNPENGVVGPNIVFKGANVHIESGSGFTVDPKGPNGLGNLVIGYDEDHNNSSIDTERTGSNNLIIGSGHEFRASGALLAGYQNVSDDNYSVVEGACNAVGFSALTSCNAEPYVGGAITVSGGDFNTARASFASVSGGRGNTASGSWSSVVGGEDNTASGDYSVVSAGFQNSASSTGASISGGAGNTAKGGLSSISGGAGNTASGSFSSVSGGGGNPLSDPEGGNTASGEYSVVSGGSGNAATGDYSSVGGGQNQSAPKNYQNIN